MFMQACLSRRRRTQLDKGHPPIVMVGDRIPTLTERLQGSIQKQGEAFNGVRLSPERAKDPPMESRHFDLIEPDALPPLIDTADEVLGPMIFEVLRGSAGWWFVHAAGLHFRSI
jgi:hypothetical protein